MLNIIKALNYQTRRDNVTIYAFLFGIFMSAIMFTDTDVFSFCGDEYTVYSGEMVPMITGMMMLILITRICAWDQVDKTINYEMLSGHSRKSVYFSRVIVSLVWGISSAVIITAVPVTVMSLLNGWGDVMELKGALIRYALLLFPLIRLACGFVFISFITGNFMASALACFLIIDGEMMAYTILKEMATVDLSFEMGMSNILKLLEFNSRMGFIDGKDVMVYDASLPADMIVKTVVFSLAASALYLILGYFIFKKRDMK